MKDETINTIGIWVVRILLVGGAIYCAVTGRVAATATMIGALLLTFLFP